MAALIVATAPRIATAPTTQLPLRAPAASPAIAEYPDGSFEVLSLPDVSYVGSANRSPSAANALRVAVALVNFDDAPAEPFEPASVAETLFGGEDSVARLYAEQSFGLAQLSGDVFGWLTLARGNGACDFSGWAERASASIGAATLSAYTNLLVVFPNTPECAWSGLAYVSGTTAWVNGEPTVRSVAHELGHNLGLGHASSLSCSHAGEAVALGEECEKDDEYGDPFSLMGSGGTLHLNAIHKRQLGWLGPENVVEVTESGVFELAPLGSASERPQALALPHGADTLLVEYRSASGEYERFGGPHEPSGGVTARIARGSPRGSGSLLVDATPRTATHADAQLEVGRELVDAASGLRVITRSVTPQRARIEVVLDGDAGPRAEQRLAEPSIVVAAITPGARRARVDLAWQLAGADDGARVSHYLVLRNGRVVARPSRPRLTRFERHGRHEYRVLAVERSGRRGASSRPLRATTTAPRRKGRMRAPLRGVTARPTADGRIALRASQGGDGDVRAARRRPADDGPTAARRSPPTASARPDPRHRQAPRTPWGAGGASGGRAGGAARPLRARAPLWALRCGREDSNLHGLSPNGS